MMAKFVSSGLQEYASETMKTVNSIMLIVQSCELVACAMLGDYV